MNRNNMVALIVGIILVAIGIYLLIPGLAPQQTITNFQECVQAGYPVTESFPSLCKTPTQTFTEVIQTPLEIQTYFVQALREKAIEVNGGRIPIEGFDPALYQGALPGLQDSDFDNAQAISGVWKLQNNELIFVRDPNAGHTSADGTITDVGVLTVLENLEKRLALRLTSRADVDILLIDLAQQADTYCTPQSREAQSCIALYQPVCGWNDPAKIQCVRYPCAQTYSNSCVACQNSNVLYWTPGVCTDA